AAPSTTAPFTVKLQRSPKENLSSAWRCCRFRYNVARAKFSQQGGQFEQSPVRLTVKDSASVSKPRLFSSLAVAILSFIAMVVARATKPSRHDLNLGFCYVCIGSCQDDQKFAIFNDPKFGPWAQIMTEVVDTRSPQKSYRIVSYFGGRIGSDTGRTSKVTWLEALGAYYRRYEFQSSP